MTTLFRTRPKPSATPPPEFPSKIPLPTTPTTTIPSTARSKTKTTLRLSQVTMNRTPLSFCLLPSPPPSPPPSPSSLSSSCIRKIMPGFLKKEGVAGSHDDLVVPLKRGVYAGDKLEKGWVRVRRFPVAPHLVEAGGFEMVGDEEIMMEDEDWVLVN